MPPRADQPTETGLPLIRLAEQTTLAALVVASFVAMLAWLACQQAATGRLLEIDEAPDVKIEYLVDINRADWAELSTLPEVGEVMARRIVESRKTDGPFRDHNDLRRVRGVGPKTLERIRPFLLPMPERGAVVGR